MTLISSLRGILAATFCALTISNPANSEIITIKDDSGGIILDYAIKLAAYREDGDNIQFVGRCDSACTLLLAMPSAQACITKNAYFRFHAPFGVSSQHEKIALTLLYNKYPVWVRDWIDNNGGLTNNFITMDYDYAKKFVTPCTFAVARF